MPISNTDDPGSPVCPTDNKVFSTVDPCLVTNPGGIVPTQCTCGEPSCTSCVLVTPATGVNTDQCSRTSGSGTAAPSTACAEAFRGTTRACDGHIVVKASPGDACLQHLHSDRPLFVVSDAERGSQLTDSPTVAVPAANGYQTTVTGQVLTNPGGAPLVAPVPQFTKLWVSGVIDRGADQLLIAQAANGSGAQYLRMQDGIFSFASLEEEQLCAGVLPSKATAGRLLIVDTVPGCAGEEWCVKELDLSLTDGICVNLTASLDANGNTAIGFTEPPKTPGFLRTDPDANCTPVNGDELSDADTTQFIGFIRQAFCDPTLPTSTVDITRVIGCGTRTAGEAVTTGAMSYTIKELFEALEDLRKTDPALADPTDNAGLPLVDGLCYDACWDVATKGFKYRLAYSEQKTAWIQVGSDYTNTTTTSVNDEETYGISLNAYGVVTGSNTHATVLFQLDQSGTGKHEVGYEQYTFVKVGGQMIAWAGHRAEMGTGLVFNAQDTGGATAFVTYDIPITSGAVSFILGRVNEWTSSNARSVSFARAILLGLKTIPV